MWFWFGDGWRKGPNEITWPFVLLNLNIKLKYNKFINPKVYYNDNYYKGTTIKDDPKVHILEI